MNAAICRVQAKGSSAAKRSSVAKGCLARLWQTWAADGGFLCKETSKLQHATAAICAGMTATNRMWVNVYPWGQLATYQ